MVSRGNIFQPRLIMAQNLFFSFFFLLKRMRFYLIIEGGVLNSIYPSTSTSTIRLFSLHILGLSPTGCIISLVTFDFAIMQFTLSVCGPKRENKRYQVITENVEDSNNSLLPRPLPPPPPRPYCEYCDGFKIDALANSNLFFFLLQKLEVHNRTREPPEKQPIWKASM